MTDAREADLRFRRPWYWLIVIVAVAVVCGIFCLLNANDRIVQGERQFRTAQQLRVTVARQSIDDLFGDAVQLAGSGSAIYAVMPSQRSLLSHVTRELFASALNRHIYGAGVFYAPNRLSGQLVSVYVRRVDPGLPLTAGHTAFANGVEIDYATAHLSGKVDYVKQSWYARAVAAGGRTVIWGPYRGVYRTFISFVRAFYAGGRLRGVFLVDVIEPDFIAVMRRGLIGGDVAAVVNRDGHVLLSTGPLPVDRSSFVTATAAVRFAPHSYLEVLSDASALHADERTIWLGTAGLLAALLVVAALIVIGVVQRWRGQERQQRLEHDQLRLEREIAIAHTVEAELRKAAYTDTLTGLANRLAFAERANEIIASGGKGNAVILIDLDRFAIINETLGHSVGDELLRTISARLNAVVETCDLVARAGGDEFLLLGPVNESRSMDWIGSAIMSHLGEPMVVDGRTLYPEASMGIVVIDDSYRTADEVLRDADIAMYEAKRRGRGRFVIFDADMRRRVAGDSELENALRRALERGELVPYYQPLVNVRTGTIEGFEALARWQREDTVVPASEFMPFAEAHGLVAAIDVRMLEEVSRHSRAIYDLYPGAKISVNISASELAAPGLFETIDLQRGHAGRSCDRLELEITETAMMTSSEAAQRTVERLKEAGIDFVLDDFGTGYSSLAYLQQLPIAGIKIDRAFVEPLPGDQRAVEIVRSIVMLARSFGLSVTAEGVETREQFECLRDLQIDVAQGFFFSPAIDISSLVRLHSGNGSSRSAVE
jgi:diguanylate cyclase (GGDEF)-like protein